MQSFVDIMRRSTVKYGVLIPRTESNNQSLLHIKYLVYTLLLLKNYSRIANFRCVYILISGSHTIYLCILENKLN